MTVDRPYVDQRVVDEGAARQAATMAAQEWGLPRPELVRVGMNAIYGSGDAVIRVGRATAPASTAHDLVAVLLERGVPVVHPIVGCAADIDGFAVTAWNRVRVVDRPVDWEAVGAAVAVVHGLAREDLPPAYPLPSPTVFPWWDFEALLASVDAHIDQAAIVGLRRTIDAGRGWIETVVVDPVVCHGDVHPGNVMMTASGPLLIDFDLMCRAAPAWDHAMLTTYSRRWGGDPHVYEAFAAGYGWSAAGDPLTATIAELRNVAATLMRVRAGITDRAARDEAERRLRFWRGDPDAPQWQAQ
jgi:hypothetical protein